jgi:hypothetical protein
MGRQLTAQSNSENKVNYKHKLSTSEFNGAYEARLVGSIGDSPQITREPANQQQIDPSRHSMLSTK